MTTRNVRTLAAASFMALALGSFPALAQAQFGEVPAPNVPPAIQVPAGHTAFLRGHAEGTQNFVCLATASGYAYKFIGPQATLFVNIKWFGGEIRQQITTHYLSANPAEAGLLRPTWQSSLDTSAVWAKAIGDPVVVPGAIPWLLLQVVGSRPGPSGGAMLNAATYLQRIDTTGGVMPATGCSEAANVGAMVFVPYTADYVFYKAKKN
jgi:Protein of unknown function (DUF3455)